MKLKLTKEKKLLLRHFFVAFDLRLSNSWPYLLLWVQSKHHVSLSSCFNDWSLTLALPSTSICTKEQWAKLYGTLGCLFTIIQPNKSDTEYLISSQTLSSFFHHPLSYLEGWKRNKVFTLSVNIKPVLFGSSRPVSESMNCLQMSFVPVNPATSCRGAVVQSVERPGSVQYYWRGFQFRPWHKVVGKKNKS